jgi:hypothetical protein
MVEEFVDFVVGLVLKFLREVAEQLNVLSRSAKMTLKYLQPQASIGLIESRTGFGFSE